jgi:hypothetical protein
MLAQIDRHLHYNVVDDDDDDAAGDGGEDVVVEEGDDADDSVEIVKEVATAAAASTSGGHGQQRGPREGYCLFYFLCAKIAEIQERKTRRKKFVPTIK